MWSPRLTWQDLANEEMVGQAPPYEFCGSCCRRTWAPVDMTLAYGRALSTGLPAIASSTSTGVLAHYRSYMRIVHDDGIAQAEQAQ